MSFNLPADAEDTVITITIPKGVAPYFRTWYNLAKKDGENPKKFALRILGRAAFRYMKNVFVKGKDDTASLDKIALINEEKSIVEQYGLGD